MNTHNYRLIGFGKLGHYLQNIRLDNPDYKPLYSLLQRAKNTNGWFTEQNCLQALQNWGKALSSSSLTKWVNQYTFPDQVTSKQIGLVLAGNIPLVGFHDVLSVLMTGHRAVVKLASSDPFLIPFLIDRLVEFQPQFKNRIIFTDQRLESFDAVIATGSNNAARYFEHYFGHLPHIIRKNRNGVAVLDGQETPEQLNGLAKDIFSYFGLGCRNISKVYLPKGYDLDVLFKALYPYQKVIESAKYANNYDYNKAVFLMSEYSLLDNGFILLREEENLSSPVACLHYSFYDDLPQLNKQLKKQADQIQCISSELAIEDAISLGRAQLPALWDYADGVDSIDFLLKL